MGPRHTLFLHCVFSVGLDCVIAVGKRGEKSSFLTSTFPNQVLNLSQFPLVSAAARITRYSVLVPPLLAGLCQQLLPLEPG